MARLFREPELAELLSVAAAIPHQNKFIMRFALGLFITFTFCACANNADVKQEVDESVGNLFYDYQVTAEEGSDSVTVLLQYRPADSEGDAVAFTDGRISIDKKPLALDSAPNGNHYYEAVLPLSDFVGRHTIAVTAANGKTHQQAFDFTPLKLTEEPGEQVKKEPFTIRLKGVPANGTLLMVLTDTSFASAGVNEELRITGDSLRVTQTMLNAVKAGPVVLHLQAETEQPISGNNKRGGRLVVTTSLKREFELVEQ